MPNHITNCLIISHDEPKKIVWLRDCFEDTADGSQNLDFNKIIPQPENIFRGDLGSAEKEMCKKEGRPNWYDWNTENWGTKWGAYDGRIIRQTDPNKIVCEFLTAWCPPEPIFVALEKMGFTIAGLWKDEGSDGINQINGDSGGWYAIVDFEYGG